jgi:methylthioribose-1-phosphate isomerase
MTSHSSTVEPIVWTGHSLRLLDQRLLPHEVVYVECKTAEAVADAIRTMIVRGAPAIGVCAAFGIALAAGDTHDRDSTDRNVHEAASLLGGTRPTAINLAWAIDRMLRVAAATTGPLHATMVREAESMFREDIAANRRIGRFGAELLGDDTTILTHCNAGALATAGYGTALGVVRATREAGKRIAIFAGETRPYLQGARLTAWELQQDGFDVTLITDNMSGHFFARETFDAVIVGADRIAANGDTANKIGTYTLAVLAHAHDVPFYIAAPLSTIDLQCPNGAAIPIEERSGSEVTETLGWDRDGQQHRVRVAPDGIAVRHPAFDVTPARLITAIITDAGVLRAPYATSIAEAFSRSGSAD